MRLPFALITLFARLRVATARGLRRLADLAEGEASPGAAVPGEAGGEDSRPEEAAPLAAPSSAVRGGGG